MSIIRVLPEYVFNKIAAGEVIERPASVVKELVENAIDAGACKIVVNIENAGLKLISVSDDGSGMDKDDAILSLEPHATSKIKSESDIEKIMTLGFRGEALPSVASISRFTLRTKMRSAKEGVEVIVNGGKFLSINPTGCAYGTEMIVRDLFFNTPARKKFMRSPPTEEKHIQEMLMMLSLPYPQIAFELNMDGTKVFSSPAHNNLLPRIQLFFGKETASNFIPINYSAQDMKISGFIAKHGFTRNSRREQRVFVNGRPIEAMPVFTGIREGYGSLLERGRFPPTLLFINIDPALVDVNVHPAKRELRFRNDRSVITAIAEAVKISLKNYSSPSVTFRPSTSLRSILSSVETSYVPAEKIEQSLPSMEPEEKVQDYQAIPTPRQNFETNEAADNAAPLPAAYNNEYRRDQGGMDASSMKIIGFLDKTYILATTGSGLIIIDQHAAHERVLYEKILKRSSMEPVLSQKLLIPITAELSRPEALFIEKNTELFASCGFDIEPFGQNTVLLTAIPAAIEQKNSSGLLREILDELMNSGNFQKIDTAAIAMASCKAAVKAHDLLTTNEAEALIKQMSKCDMPFSCPHGRPTVINISISELERRFGRR